MPTPDALDRYVIEHSIPGDRLVAELVEETTTVAADLAIMQLEPIQARFLYLLVKLTGAKDLLEVGTFTGMSSLWMARALPPDGRILCCDISEEWTAIARRYWERAGVADKIELRLGPAGETLRSLPAGTDFDLVFIDADKGGYPDYLEQVVPRLRPGGVLVADNVLRRGEVADPENHSEATEAIRRFNRRVVDHPDLEGMILPVADGMTLARKR